MIGVGMLLPFCREPTVGRQGLFKGVERVLPHPADRSRLPQLAALLRLDAAHDHERDQQAEQGAQQEVGQP
jgi:hypothetical protein